MNKKNVKINNTDLLISILGILAFISFLFWASTVNHTKVFYPETKIANIDISGKTFEEAKNILENDIANYRGTSFGEDTIKPMAVGIKYDVDKTLQKAYLYGRHQNLLTGINERLFARFRPRNYDLEIIIGKEFSDFLMVKTDTFNSEVGVTTISWDKGLKYKEGAKGKRLLITDTKISILEKMQKLESGQTIKSEEILPRIVLTKEDLDAIEAMVKEPIVLGHKGKSWEIKSKNIIDWINLDKQDLSIDLQYYLWPTLKGVEIKTTINSESVGKYVESIAKQIDIPVRNARLKIEGGRATIFEASRDGLVLERQEAIDQIIKSINGANRTISLVVAVKVPDIREDNINNLGISELVSVGTSSFYGSPANRLHNIKTGSSRFDGAIIAPGQTFSFNAILGPVDASTGYAEELVILKDRTEKQYGGGLCQVSSTAFRAALNGGFPIVERINHAYPVVYYYPIGTDATIYLPKPDFRFKNDSHGHLLIQTTALGTTLKFEFYGTKMNRNVKFGGNAEGEGTVEKVEEVKPYLYDQGWAGKDSVKSIWYRFIYEDAKLTKTDRFVSAYESPNNYPY